MSLRFGEQLSMTPLLDPGLRGPFRLRVRPAMEESVEVLSRRQRRQGDRAFQKPGEARYHAAAAKDASLARILSWAHHPDEFVPLALLSNPNRTQLLAPHGGRVEAELLARALADARRERVRWTPLLDALDAEGLWVSPRRYRRLTRRKDHRSAHEMWRSVRLWAHTADPASQRHLQGFRTPRLERLLEVLLVAA